jgi:hypothetical protein
MVRMMLSGSCILLLLELVDFAQICPVTWLLADASVGTLLPVIQHSVATAGVYRLCR